MNFKKCTFLFLFIFLVQLVSYLPVNAVNDNKIYISYGAENEQLGQLTEGTEKEGPKSFAVMDSTIYILDSVKKRVVVYSDGKFDKEILIDYCNYPLDIVCNGTQLYIYDDPDNPIVYQVSLDGKLINKCTVSIPSLDRTRNSLKRLSVGSNGSVYIVDCAYNEYELDSISGTIKTPSKGISNKYNTQRYYGQIGKDGKRHLISLDSNIDIPLDTQGVSSGVEILGYDKDENVYVLVLDMANTSKTSVEFAVTKYDKNGTFSGVARIPIEQYYYTPIRMVNITPEGNVYLMITGKSGVEFRNLGLSSSINSNILSFAQEQLQGENENAERDNSVLRTFNSRQTTNDRAWAIDNCYWYYAQYNYQPVPSGAMRPDWLTAYNENKYGIPYCWGGFDAMDRHSDGTSWSNYVDAMNNQIFAGNVYCNGSYKTGTAGLDCAGYCGACLGYSNPKPGTWTLWGDSHSHSLSERGLCDIYIEPNTHVLFFISEQTDGTGIISAEATTSGDDKCKIYSRTYSWLNSGGYSLRSFW
ncbi:MAG: hypothetical protein ABFC94_14785 [Syntrophomonas sp.]